MTWIQKMDAVLKSLYEHSGDNPRFSDLQEYLKDLPISKGELQDVTLYFYNEGLMYSEYGGDRTHQYSEHYDVRYLLSCKGKLFWEDIGGFEQQKTKASIESDRVKNLESSQQKLMSRLNLLTFWVAAGTVALALIELLSALKLLN